MEIIRVSSETFFVSPSLLLDRNACDEGYQKFISLYPDGEFLKPAAEKLKKIGEREYAAWLYRFTGWRYYG